MKKEKKNEKEMRFKNRCQFSLSLYFRSRFMFLVFLRSETIINNKLAEMIPRW